MISRFSTHATPSRSDESGLNPDSSRFASGFDEHAQPCGGAREYAIRQELDNPKGFSLKTMWLCAVLAVVPALIVASWFQYRVVSGLETELTATEARTLAAKMDGVIDARTSALRMAAGSLEIENLAASGGLNRLLGGLKDLFPDFRSLEIFTEQGQPLAMMGELSLETVRKHSRMSKGSKHEPGLISEPLFKDTPASDCFFITMKHQGTDKAVWFSRARFSREAITAVLEPQRANHNARLVSSTQQQPATDTKSAAGPRAVPAPSEPDGTQSMAWGTRSFFATAPLDTPDWTITLERKVPVSKLYYLALLLGGFLFAGSGIILVRSKKGGNAPITAQAAAVPEIDNMIGNMEQEEEPVPDASDRDPDVSEAFAQALAHEAMADVEQAEAAEYGPVVEESDVLGPADAMYQRADEDDAFLYTSAAAVEEDGCDPFVGLQEELGLSEGANLSETGTLPLESGDALVDSSDVPDTQGTEVAAADPDILEIEEDEDSVVIGEPIQLDDIPDTLEVCWTESSEEETQAAEQSRDHVVNRGYPAV